TSTATRTSSAASMTARSSSWARFSVPQGTESDPRSGFLLHRQESERLVARGRGRVHDASDRVVLHALVGLDGEDAVEGQWPALGVARPRLLAQELGLLLGFGEGVKERNDPEIALLRVEILIPEGVAAP